MATRASTGIPTTVNPYEGKCANEVQSLLIICSIMAVSRPFKGLERPIHEERVRVIGQADNAAFVSCPLP